MFSFYKITAASLLSAMIVACGPLPAAKGCEFGSVTRLYLGRDTPAGVLTEGQWEQFVAETVTPRFPEGFTVLDAHGQWRAADGSVHKEPTRVLEVVHSDNPRARARVRAVAVDYQQRFAQQSVLVSTSPTYQCMNFSGA
jgi:hypothetical protein